MIKKSYKKIKDGTSVRGEWLFFLDSHLIYKGDNLITQAGLNFIAGLLAGNNADVPIHLALGTGTKAPALTDKTLQVESLRKPISSKVPQNNIVRIRTFFLPTEANGDWKEFGLFLSGTDLPDSGTLFNRIIPPGGISKAGNQVLSVEVRITFTAGWEVTD